jgi:hypothetical protein
MAGRDLGGVFKDVQTLFSVGTVAALSDDYLLDSFLSRHEGAAEVADRSRRFRGGCPHSPGRIGCGQNPPQLRPGKSVQVTIILDRPRKALTIPDSAHRFDNDEPWCYRIINGRPVKTRVRLGEASGNRVEVLDGLQEGDNVVVQAGQGMFMSAGHPVARVSTALTGASGWSATTTARN